MPRNVVLALCTGSISTALQLLLAVAAQHTAFHQRGQTNKQTIIKVWGMEGDRLSIPLAIPCISPLVPAGACMPPLNICMPHNHHTHTTYPSHLYVYASTIYGFLLEWVPAQPIQSHCSKYADASSVFGRFDLAALCGCHTLNVCYVNCIVNKHVAVLLMIFVRMAQYRHIHALKTDFRMETHTPVLSWLLNQLLGPHTILCTSCSFDPAT